MPAFPWKRRKSERTTTRKNSRPQGMAVMSRLTDSPSGFHILSESKISRLCAHHLFHSYVPHVPRRLLGVAVLFSVAALTLVIVELLLIAQLSSLSSTVLAAANEIILVAGGDQSRYLPRRRQARVAQLVRIRHHDCRSRNIPHLSATQAVFTSSIRTQQR